MASWVGKGMYRVFTYTWIQFNNSFPKGKILIVSKDMFCFPTHTVFCFAVLISIFLYMPLIVWFIRGNRSMGFSSLAKRAVCLVWCEFTNRFGTLWVPES